MKRTFFGILFAMTGCIASSFLQAQEVGKPTFQYFNFTDGSNIRNMSDNGLWAVSFGPDAANDQWNYPRLINIAANTSVELPTGGEGVISAESFAAMDVTDDGSIVVGSYDGKPGVWSAATNKWQNLPLPSALWSGGEITAVSKDGKYAVGKGITGYTEIPVLWDLSQEGIIVETPGYPRKGLNGVDEDQIRFSGISGDGRYILGITSFSYVGSTVYFIYDREENSWFPIGFDYDAATEKYTPKVKGIHFIDNAVISPNGKYVGGTAYMVKEIEGSDFPEEYCTPFLLDMTTGEFTLFDDADSHDKSCSAIDDEGTLYASTPSNSPVRSLYVRADGYWVPLSLILKQRYGIDYYTLTGYEYTGTTIAAASNGRTIAVIPSASGQSYVLTLPEKFNTAAAGIDLLADYTVTPVEGASFSKIKDVKITFTRNVNVLGTADCAMLNDEDGTTQRVSLTLEVAANDPKSVNIGFRTYTFEEGKKYTVVIPAGSICIDGDESRSCGEIRVEYTGRADKPVEMTAVSPTAGNTVSQINFTTNPVFVTFDTQIDLTNSTGAVLYRNDETEPYCTLNLLKNGNRIAIYPTTTQYLYKDNSYRIEIEPGTVTDLTGNNGNELISISYEGAFVREITSNDSIIYSENFNSGLTGMMLYDGDKLTPGSEMAAWTFTSNTAWNYANDDDDYTNLAAVSHSMYSPAGKSDDWMVTPQIYIPDGKCTLSFRAQSYRQEKTDVLKVIVWASEKVVNDLSAANVEQMRTEGIVVYEGTESPGRNEDVLVGDWVTHSISLEQFAGKSIYVAFVNENEDQSAIFVDDLRIIRNQDFIITLSSATSVISQTEEMVKGYITVGAENKTYSSVTVTLVDQQGEVVESLPSEGLSLSKDDKHEFAFTRPLPLESGKSNTFVVRVQMDEEKDSLIATIKNLMFEPVKRVTVEEYSGMGCSNCPAGIVAMENLERIYGDRIIPVIYHTYTGDVYESGLTAYTTYLGLVAAPSGLVNRKATGYPLGVVNGSYQLYSPDGDSWLDVAEKEFEQYADADISVTAVYDGETGRITAPCTFKYALDASNLNVNLLLFVTEDNLEGYQDNNYSSMEDEVIKDWAKGGKYGTSRVYPYTFNDVARAYIGESYLGTGGYVPTEVEAGREYSAELLFALPSTVKNVLNCNVVCMMIDANTGQYINAARTKLDVQNYDAVSEVSSDAAVTVTGQTGAVKVRTQGKADITVYGVNGNALAHATCQGTATVNLGGYHGMALVRVTLGDTTVVRKVIVK